MEHPSIAVHALAQSPDFAWTLPYRVREADWAPVVVVALLVFGVIMLVFLRHRVRLQEQRLEVLRVLAEKGQATPDLVAQVLRPWSSRLKPAIMVVAWFLLLGGAGMTIAALAQDWPDRHNELGPPGLALLGIAVATLSAPLMLRELRRQGAL